MTDLPYLDADEVAARTSWPALIDALADAFRTGGVAPVRHHHNLTTGQEEAQITLLLMPAWQPGQHFGVKLAAIARANAQRGLPTLHGVYVLFDGVTGVPRAVLDAGALTARRTAAASALASRHLSRADARSLLIVGTGRVACELIRAHCAVRPIEEVAIWGRNTLRAQDVADAAGRETGCACSVATDLAAAAASADIVSCAVPTTTPVLRGDWITPGTHVDLVGAFTPAMCEADTALVARANHIFIDTMEGAREEAGDLMQAAAAGVFSFDDVAGDLFMLARQPDRQWRSNDDITLFKSVGTALEDLAAARLCLG